MLENYEKKDNLKSKLFPAFMSMALTIGILIIAYGIFGVYPNSDKIIPTMDLRTQYMPFLYLFKDKILSGESILYSTNGGLGQNYWGHIGYYTASPLNLILLFIPKAHMNDGIYILTLIKLGLMAFTMNLLLSEISKEESWVKTGLSLMYSLSYYSLAYSIHLMWLDILILLPLCILGLIRYIKNKKIVLYVVTLFLMVWSNFYIAAFACIFIALFFPFLFFRFAENQSFKSFWKNFLGFALLSLIGGLMASVLWIPTMKNLEYTVKLGSPAPKINEYKEEWSKFFFGFLPQSNPTIKLGGANIYSGILPLLLLFPYLRAENINKKTKFYGFFVLAFIIYSLNSKYLNYIWHGFSYPVSFPYRFSYLITFLLVFFAYDSYINSKSKKLILPMSLLGIILSVKTIGFVDKDDKFKILIGILLIITYSFLLLKDKRDVRKILSSLMVLEALLISINVFNYRIEDFPFLDKYEEFAYFPEVDKSIRNFENTLGENNSPFRMSNMNLERYNKGILYNYSSVDIFDSTYSKAGTEFFMNMGYMSNTMNSVLNYRYSLSLPLNDVLSVKYYINTDKENTYSYLKSFDEVYEDENITVFENPNSLAFGIYTDKEINLNYKLREIFENHNKLYRFLGAKEDIYDIKAKFICDAKNPVFTYKIEEDGFYNMNWNASELTGNSIELRVNQGEFTGLPHFYNRGCHELNYLQKGDIIDVDINEDGGGHELYFSIAKINEEAYKDFIQTAKSNNINLKDYRQGKFSANIKADKAGKVLFQLPYDEGWRIKINGENKKTINAGGLTAVDVPQGDVDISAVFIPRGIRKGGLISATAFIAFIIVIVLKKKGRIMYN